jgi:hypothetical protein
MLNLIQRWLAGASRAPTWNLSDYPPCALPHLGSGAALTDSQAQQNWAHFQATLADRLQRVRTWLLAHDGPDRQALQGVAYAKALNTWARQHWPQLPPARGLPPHPPWPAGPRHGPHVVYSLLGDLALTLGEAIRHADTNWHWGLNLDATDLADGMHSSRRVVLLADLRHPTPEAREAVLDLEAMVVHDYEFPDSPNFTHLDVWARAVEGAVSGRDYNS